MTDPDLPRSIIILGSAKSGTTALFYAIRNSLEALHDAPVAGLFEPRESKRIAAYLRDRSDPSALVKVLLGPQMRSNRRIVDRFDRRIIIHRDPRDNVVSRIVFMVQSLFDLDDTAKLADLLDLFRAKEQAPGSLSMIAMIDRIGELAGREALKEKMRASAVQPAMLKHERPDDFLYLPYEDFVAGDYAALDAYLNFPVAKSFDIGNQHSYVVRTKGSGNWRHWFLDEDVAFFAGDVADELKLLGYDPDERPHAEQAIAPRTCSEYVQAQFDRQERMRRERKVARRKRRAEADVAAG